MFYFLLKLYIYTPCEAFRHKGVALAHQRRRLTSLGKPPLDSGQAIAISPHLCPSLPICGHLCPSLPISGLPRAPWSASPRGRAAGLRERPGRPRPSRGRGTRPTWSMRSGSRQDPSPPRARDQGDGGRSNSSKEWRSAGGGVMLNSSTNEVYEQTSRTRT